MEDLVHKKCVSCEGGIPALSRAGAEAFIRQVPAWVLSDDAKRMSREFSFPDFKSALAFVSRVGALAEEEGHHPDIFLSWGKVRIELWTHAVGGLSENDFILAAKIDALLSSASVIR